MATCTQTKPQILSPLSPSATLLDHFSCEEIHATYSDSAYFWQHFHQGASQTHPPPSGAFGLVAIKTKETRLPFDAFA